MEELNLTDSDFYKYIGVTSDSSTETINKNLRQFYLKIHPDKCNLDNLREIFVDNSQILNLINSGSTNPADKDSDRQSICTKLYQLFSNKWESLQANSGEEMIEEEEDVDNQFMETFNDSLNAQFALQLVDFNTLNFYNAIINYIEANPSVTLSQDEINQIMYLLQKFVYDNKDNLFLFKDYPPPQQPLVQKGGSLNILLITLIFIFISSLFVSIQGQFATPNGIVSDSTGSTLQSKHDARKKYLNTSTVSDDIHNVFKEGQSILDIASDLSKAVKTPTTTLVKKFANNIFDVIGTQVDAYTDELDKDNLKLKESIKQKTQLKKTYEDKLTDLNTENQTDLLANEDKLTDLNAENQTDLLAKILAVSNEIKEESIKYSRSVLFKSVINTLLRNRVEIPKEQKSELFSTVKTLSSYSSNEAVLLVDDVEQIFYRFFNELQGSGAMKIPDKTAGRALYDSYIRQWIPSVTTFFKQIDEVLDKIDVSEEQRRWAEKNMSDTVGQTSVSSMQVRTENKLNNLIEKKWIPSLGKAVTKIVGLHPAVKVSIDIVSAAYSLVNSVDSARLLWGHRIYLAKTTVKSAITLLETTKNVGIEGTYEQKVAKFGATLTHKLMKKEFIGLFPLTGSFAWSLAKEWVYPTSDAKIESSIQVMYVNNFGLIVKNPVCNDLLNSGKLKLNNGNVSLEDLINSTADVDFKKYNPAETNRFFDFILKNMNETYDPTISTYQSVLGFTDSLSKALGLKDSKINLNTLITNVGSKVIKDAIQDNSSQPELGVDNVEFLVLPDLKPLGNLLREGLNEYDDLLSKGALIGGKRYKKYTNTKNTKNTKNKTKKIKKMPKTNSKKKFKKNKKNLKKSKKNKKY